MKEEAHVIEFEDIRFALQLRRVVDTGAILLEGDIAAGIFWCRCVDRYIIEGAASATHRHERNGEYATADFLQMGVQCRGNDCAHRCFCLPFALLRRFSELFWPFLDCSTCLLLYYRA